jgi:hypothetical protein
VVDANGALLDWPFGHPRTPQPAAELRDEALRVYAAAHRPGRVLVALDTSGSMRTTAGDGRRTRFEIALDSVDASLARMGGEDEFGLWLFSTDVSREGWHEEVPIGRRNPAQDATLQRLRHGFTPSGDTPLYLAIDAGSKAVRGSAGTGPDRLRALVVVTDGQDTASGGLVPALDTGAGVRVFVIAIGEASCGPVLVRLSHGTGGECLRVAATSVDQTLATLFGTLWERGG